MEPAQFPPEQSIPVNNTEDDSEYVTYKVANRISYPNIKSLCTNAQNIREELHKNISADILKHLDTFIQDIKNMCKSTSKYLDYEEVERDLEWIVEYYKKQEWNNVTRWLGNIDSSLREMWTNYMDIITASKNKNRTK